MAYQNIASHHAEGKRFMVTITQWENHYCRIYFNENNGD